MDKEAVSLLRRIGLNQYESRTYLALLNAGTASASEVSETAGIPRPRTYDILQKLSKKGFVSIQPGRPVKFKGVPIDEAFETMKSQKREELTKEMSEIENINSKLKTRVKKIEPQETQEDIVWVLKERKNIYSKMESLINNATNSILIATTENGLSRKMEAHEESLRKASQRGVEITIITPKETKHTKTASEFAKIIKKEHPHRMIVADDHTMLFLTPENEDKKEVGAWINSSHFADNARKIY